MSDNTITNLTVSSYVSLITLDSIPNKTSVLSEIFTTISDAGINIDMINQTAPYRGVVNVSFTISDDDLAKAITVLGQFKKKIPDLRVEVNSNNTKLSVYGEAMRNMPGVAAKLFTVLAENDIDIKLVTTSEVDISCLIYEKDTAKAVEAIKEAFDIL
ncbi:MAG: ACT domain-containing protein [Clostridiaceae bacterium]|nr:ACT domain-containing protein [Clostridiaceae bacterium]